MEMPLHHEPTRGGKTESEKLGDGYQKTLDSYKQFFGESPPKDIWPSAEIRFGRDTQCQWVNLQQNWILSKAFIFKLSIFLIFAICLTIVGKYYGQGAIENLTLSEGIPLALVLVLASVGISSVIIGLIDYLQHPNAPRFGLGYGGGGVGCGGCGGGWNSGGGDSSGSDSGGCSGGGCGGGCGG
ncbi:hypothetical protein CKA32_000777 [Geitlerinema sp. FC II]|nr:hypothetical protein [Geitlerinema sp. CS-897]PPT05377.1 hypothetical protein CKA32_000777 [Geitlerinema sp. FC II]